MIRFSRNTTTTTYRKDVFTITTFTVKDFRDTASGACSFSLYENGQRVAIITNEGRGGPDSIEPILTSGPGRMTLPPKIWREEVDRLEAALTAYDVPEWYRTSFGVHDRIDSHWELTLGYLSEIDEYERIAKRAKFGRTLLRMPDGRLLYGLATHPANKDALHWADGDWRPYAA